MDTVTITTIEKMSDQERIDWARSYTSERNMSLDDLTLILDAARDGKLTQEPEALLAVVFDDKQNGELRERALQALYHHIAAARKVTDDDEESIPALGRIIEQLVRAPKAEHDEKLRGQKCWIKLQHLIYNEAPSEVRVDTIQHFCRNESSAFVLERVAAAISGDIATLFSIFPLDGTWSPPDTDEWNRLERVAIQQTHRAGQILGAVRRRAPDILSGAAGGGGAAGGADNFRRYVESLDAAERDHVVAPPHVLEVLKTLSPLGRNRVLTVCSGGSTREDTPRLSRYLAGLIEMTALTEPAMGQRDWADQFTILGLQATIANVGTGATDAPLSHLVEPALELLSRPLPEHYNCSATRHALSKLAGGILRVVFTDPGETAAIMARVDKGELTFIDPLKRALKAASPYIVNVAADLALLLSRSRALPPELISPLLKRLSQSPATEGEMCKGCDLRDDDIAVPDGVVLVYSASEPGSPDAAAPDAAAPDAPASGGHDGFFSVSGLTELLERCREPYCAWRIAAALTTYADTHKDAQLITQLLAYAGENKVVDRWNPLVEGTPAPVSKAATAYIIRDDDENGLDPTTKVDPNQPGPFTLSEIVQTLGRVVETPRPEWPDLQEAVAREREQELQSLVSHFHRSRIIETFGGANTWAKADMNPLVPIATQILHRGFSSFVPLPSFVPGTLDDLHHYDSEQNIDPINSTETLAYYVAKDCLPAARSHQWGIYFRVKPFVALNRAVSGNLQALVEPVAVHELVHHHTAVRTQELRIDRTCGTFRLLEEATADWNAVQRLTQMLKDHAISSARHEEIMRLVFPRREDGGLPGYGDWPLMDADAAPLAPYFESKAWYKPSPNEYRSKKQLLMIATVPPEITPIQLPREHRLWASVLAAIGTGEIPMYLDFQ